LTRELGHREGSRDECQHQGADATIETARFAVGRVSASVPFTTKPTSGRAGTTQSRDSGGAGISL